ncbi:MAG: 1-deoxy-D-xylulose-5-phosphate reductoisomerase [Actinomycetia bacterium]|nr:1-deoxy-D-xylulose-5-phosphate reductoisomerase [Actinomycetes bacterium]
MTISQPTHATPDSRAVTLLGSTGSIGTQALDIISRNPQEFQVSAITATGRDPRLVAQQAVAFSVPVIGLADDRAQSQVQAAISELSDNQYEPDFFVGPDAATRVAGLPTDVVLNGISGAAGLLPTVAALRAGTTLALANKESLIIGGPVVKALAEPSQIVPVDSEHSALAQCLRSGSAQEVSRLVLTASGGPFRGWSAADLARVSPAAALSHPTWDMGPLVTVNSATLVNKGLEMIEAHLLFDIPFDRIDVVVHPQSVVHSMVEFVDGATIAQASPPDMRLPIALGLAWPARVPDAAPRCDWTQATQWTFEPVDTATFPAIEIAATAGAAGGIAPAVFNAADEVAVGQFLAGKIAFPAIVDTIGRVLSEALDLGDDGVLAVTPDPAVIESVSESAAEIGDNGASGNSFGVADVLAADAWARSRAAAILDAS